MFKNITKILFCLMSVTAILANPLCTIPAEAFSVDVKNLYYYDPSGPREIDYNFSVEGDFPPSVPPNNIRIPSSSILQKNIADMAFMFGNIPDMGSATVTLNTTSQVCTIATTQGGAMLQGASAPPPAPQPPPPATSWTFRLALQNFSGITDPAKEYRFSIGTSPMTAGPHPRFRGIWNASGHLELSAAIKDETGNGTTLWEGTPVSLSGLTPAATALELQIVNNATTVTFSYRVNGGGWTNMPEAYTIPPDIVLQSLPSRFPIIFLEERTPEIPFQVDVSHLLYNDHAVPPGDMRQVNYDFSGGAISNNTISIPDSAVTKPPLDASLTYTFGPYPDPSNAITLQLNTGSCTMSTSTDGGAIINTSTASQTVPLPTWTFEVKLQNFTGITESGKSYKAQIGMASMTPVPHPELTAMWQSNGTLQLNGEIYDDTGNGTSIWKSSIVTLSGQNIANTAIELRVSRPEPPNAHLLQFEYRLNGGSWTALESYTIPEVQRPTNFLSFPGLFPYVSLRVESQGGGGGTMDPFHAFSNHMQGFGYSALIFVDDPNLIYSSVTAESQGFLTTTALELRGNQWWLPNNVQLGPTMPTIFPSFHIVATKKDLSGTDVRDKAITGYVADFVTVTSPSPSAFVTAPPIFSWTWPAGAPAVNWYGINVWDTTASPSIQVMNQNGLPGSTTSLPYTGPSLINNHVYSYTIGAGVNMGDELNSSQTTGTFTFGTGGGPTISFTGDVKAAASYPGTPVSGATVQVLGLALPPAPVTTDGAGHFELTGIPEATNFSLMISNTAGGFVPAYSKMFNWNQNIQMLLPFGLFTQTEYNDFGIATGNGIILGRVTQVSSPNSFLVGATVMAVDWTAGTPGTVYPVTYTNPADSATGVDGAYYVKNVPDGRVVKLTVSLPGGSFSSPESYVPVYAGGVSEESFFVTAQQSPFNVYSYHQDTHYYINLFVDDPAHSFTGVTVNGPDLSGDVSLTYIDARLRWEPPVGVGISLGTTLPTEARTYNFTAATGGTPVTGSKTVSVYVEGLAADLLPTGDVSGTPTFSWTGISNATSYSVMLNDQTDNNNLVWTSPGLGSSQTSVLYNGSALTTGHTYQYTVISANNTDGNSNSSFARAQFTYTGSGSTVTVSGTVRDWNNAVIPAPGVTVSLVGDGSKTTTSSTTDGTFSLPGISANTPFSLKFSRTGYLDVYIVDIGGLAADMNITSDAYGGVGPILMPMTSDLTAFGAMPATGKAIIASRVSDQTYRYSSNIGGVVVTATGNGSKNYPVTYRDPFGVLGGSATYGNGRFYALNVDDGDTVTVTATKNNWTFNTRTFHTHGDTLSQGRTWGTAPGYDASLSGFVKRWTNGAAVPGATIALSGDPLKNTTTAGNGSYTFSDLPKDANFYAKITASGYVDLYAGPSSLNGSMSNVSNVNFPMLTAAEMTDFGVNAGNGIIIGAVVDLAVNPLSGATITVTNKKSLTKTYTVTYEGGGNATSATGKFYVSDVLPGDVVKISTTLNGYSFADTYIDSFAPYVNGKYIWGTATGQTYVVGAYTGYQVKTPDPNLYSAYFIVKDPADAIQTVTVMGNGLTTPATLFHDAANHQWQSWSTTGSGSVSVNFGNTLPAGLPYTYTFTITTASGTTTQTAQISQFVTVTPSSTSPAANSTLTGTPTFTWTSVGGTYEYEVQVFNASGSRIWYKLLTGTSVVYDGPALTPGNYTYSINVNDTNGDFSMITVPFTYTTSSVHVSQFSADLQFKFLADITTDGTTGFYLSGWNGSGSGFDSQQIFKIGMSGGAATVFSAANNPSGITNDGAYIYWIDPNGDPDATAIFRIPIAGGSREKIYSGSATGQPVVDGSGIKFVPGSGTPGILVTADEVQGRVHKMTATKPVTNITQIGGNRYGGFFDSEHVNVVAVDGGTVYVSDMGKAGYGDTPPRIQSISLAGGSFSDIYVGSLPGFSPRSIAVNAGIIYIANGNQILQAPTTGGTPTLLVSDPRFVSLQGMIFYNNALYVLDNISAGSQACVWKVDLAAASTITISGTVTDWKGAVITASPITVTLVGSSPAITTTTSTLDGAFSLPGVPAGQAFWLKFSDPNGIYMDVYTPNISSTNDLNITASSTGATSFNIPKQSDLSTSGVMPVAGKALIASMVSDNTYRFSSNVGGAVVTATSASHPGTPYFVIYRDPLGKLGGTATYGNGRYYVLNVDAGDTVTVSAAKNGWSFTSPRTFHTYANSVDEGRVTGTAPGYDASMSGYVKKNSDGSVISGARIELYGDSGKFTNTAQDGSYIFSGLPRDATFYLKVTAAGYVTTYAGPTTLQGGIAGVNMPMLTSGDMTGFGVAQGNGMIVCAVVDLLMNRLSGATATYVSKMGQTYTIAYDGGGSATGATGKFYIANILPGDVVKIDVTVPGYTFTTTYMDGFSGSVSAKYIRGSAIRGDIDGNKTVNLADAILALQLFTGLNPAIRTDYLTSGTDVNADNAIGPEEVIYIMQIISGLRQSSSSIGPCSSLAGNWIGTFLGTGCGSPDSGTAYVTINADCSGQSVNSHNSTGGCFISGNTISCTTSCILCGTQNTPGTVNSSATVSGNSASGTYSGCNGVSGTWTIAK